MLEKLSVRGIAMIVGAVLLVGIILFGLDQCRSRQTASKQNEVSHEQGSASVHAGADAMNTVSNVEANDAATDAAVAQGQAAIRNAPEGQKGAATKSALCQLKTYRDTPQCKEPPR
jgi:FtsZ-interacting cell division protein ZipA